MRNFKDIIIEKLKVSKNNTDDNITFEDVVDALAVYCEKHNSYTVAELFEYDGLPIPKVLLPEFKHTLGYINRISYIEFEGNELINGVFWDSRTNKYKHTLIRTKEELVYCLGGDDKSLGYEMLDKLYLDLNENNK